MTHLYTILVGGFVLPGPDVPAVEAVAWADDTLIGLGSATDVLGMSRGDSHVTDLRGAFVVPLGAAADVAWPAEVTLGVGGRADLAVLDADPRLAHAGAPLPRQLAVIRAGRVVAGELGGQRMGIFEAIDSGEITSRAYATGVGDAGTPGVVVFHAWWGLNGDVIAYADRLAAAGYFVLAPDLYRGPVVSTIEGAERLSRSLDRAAADAIALAVIDRMAERLGPSARLGALGFSLGAAWSMWSPAQRDRLAASVVYYGSISGPSLTRASVPVLGHFAEADPYEPDGAVAEFESTLRSAGRETVLHRYPGTGHWFAEPSRDAYRADAAELAFERTVAFLDRHLGRASD